jgi:flavin-dependent dehydrogenase
MPTAPGAFDVVIAGAGLAGGTLALRLARAGARVALVDHARFPRDKLCGEFLSPECWGVFERLGLAPAVERLGYHAIRRVRITTPRGRAVEAGVTGPDGRPGIGLSRSALDDLVVRAARAAGVEVLEGARVTGPVVRDGRVAGAVARRGADEPFELPAAVTVAADGRHSSLVRLTGTTRGRSWLRPRMFGLKCHLAVTPAGDDDGMEPPGTVGLHLVAGGYVGACRVESGQANLCGLLPEAVLRRYRGDLARLAHDVFPGNPVLGRLWASARPAGAWKAVAGVRVEWSRPEVPGILYAGDCQGTIDPLGGQGMTMALLGAEMLAPFITRTLAGPNPGVDAETQAAYAAAWQHRFGGRIRLCRAFHHALVNPWLIDAASTLRFLAPRLLALGFDRTREPSREVS